jgi:hypothetical protein
LGRVYGRPIVPDHQQLRREYFQAVASTVAAESDWVVNLWLCLLFLDGGGTAVDEPIRRSFAALGRQIGTNSRPGEGSPTKPALVAAGKRLVEIGAVKRWRIQSHSGKTDGPGTPYEWALRRPIHLQRHLPWDGAYDFVSLVVRRSEAMAPKHKALMLRLACIADEEGIVGDGISTIEELAPLVKVKTERTLEASMWTLERSGCGVTYQPYYLGVRRVHDISLSPLEARRRRTDEEIEDELERLRGEAWFPELIERAIEKLPPRRRTSARQLDHFYKPAVALQKAHPYDRDLVEYAFSETLKSDLFRDGKAKGFGNYAEAVARNHAPKFARRRQRC